MEAPTRTLADVIADPALEKQLVETAAKRLRASDEFYGDRLDAMIRCYKIYRAIRDASDDDEEFNAGANYAFGMIEDAVAALSESILTKPIPTPARAKSREDEEVAERVNAGLRSYYTAGEFQEDYPNSVRERAIVGSSVEIDCWRIIVENQREWQKPTTMVDEFAPAEVPVEVEKQVEVESGFYTRFPSIFNVFFQPRVDKVEKMRWVLEIQERVALDELRGYKYVDSQGQEVAVFNVERFIAKKKEGGGRIQPQPAIADFSDRQRQLREIIDQQGGDDQDPGEDVDQLTLLWVYEPNRMYCVANNEMVIAYIENPYHRPGLRVRIKRWTPQPHSIYGVGLIEPCEDDFGTLDDIRRLAMRNWVRIINKMIAYNPNSIVDKNDFKPRAGGKIRVDPGLGQSVAGQIVPIDQPDVSKSMLTMESNIKGNLERNSGRPDFAPGVEGTKLGHDTLGGLDKIEAMVNKRNALLRRQELAGFQKQARNFYEFMRQFLIDKKKFMGSGEDGSPKEVEFDLFDLDTGGRGLDFVIEWDPAAGDDAIARQQGLLLLDVAIKFNEAEMKMRGPQARVVDLAEIMRLNLQKFGHTDTSRMLKRLDGIKTADEEHSLMEQGLPTPVQDLEDKSAHLADHVRHLEGLLVDPAAPPELVMRLQAHVEATRLSLNQDIMDPIAAGRKRLMAQQTMALASGQAPGLNPAAGTAGVTSGRPPAPGPRR